MVDSVSNPRFLDRRNKMDRRKIHTHGMLMNKLIISFQVVFRREFETERSEVRKRDKRRKFIGLKIKVELNFHGVRGADTGGGSRGSLGRVLVREYDGEGILLIGVTRKNLGQGGNGRDDDGGLALLHQEARAVVLVDDGCHGQLTLSELDTNPFELKRWVRVGGENNFGYLQIRWMLEFVKKNLISLTYGLNVGGGVSEGVEGACIVIRTETKQQSEKKIERQGKNELPGKDWGTDMAAQPLHSDDVLWHEVKAKHLLGEGLEDSERRLTLGLVTIREALALHLETALHIIPGDAVNPLLYQGPEGVLILSDLFLTLLQQFLASLQGCQAGFGGACHRGNVMYLKLVTDRGTWDRTIKGNVTGKCGWMPLDDICFDFNPNSVFVFSTVQVFSRKEGIRYSVGYNWSVTLCNRFM